MNYEEILKSEYSEDFDKLRKKMMVMSLLWEYVIDLKKLLIKRSDSSWQMQEI